MNRRTSIRKVEANRQNALRSTGPRTEDGKRRVKLNALKHGLLAQAVVISVGDSKEDPAEFDDLLTALVEHLQPAGKMEEMLVEEIAVAYWRRRRALRAESGEIRRETETVGLTTAQKRMTKLARSKKNWNVSGLKKSSEGLQVLIETFDGIRDVIERDTDLANDTQEWLTEHFEWDALMLADVPGQKNALLDQIEQERATLQQLKEAVERREACEREAELARRALPPVEALAKILRYEAAIDRQLHRAMTQLERLQRQRRGDHVPPPISIEVSQAE